MTCTHPDFTASVEVHRIGSGVSFMAEVAIRCSHCLKPFRFLGPPTGLSFTAPTVDIPATTLHVPITPGERSLSEVPDSIRVEVSS